MCSWYHFYDFSMSRDRIRDLPFPEADTLPTELPGPVKDIIPEALLMRTSCNFILFIEYFERVTLLVA